MFTYRSRFLFILWFFITSQAYAGPNILIPENIGLIPGGNIQVPIYIENYSDATIGFVFRLGYDNKMLLNPTIITDNTQSDGKQISYVICPSDRMGRYSVGVVSPFIYDNQENILLKIKFDVSSQATGDFADIGFVEPNDKTLVFRKNETGELAMIEADYFPIKQSDTECSSFMDINLDCCTDLEDIITLLKVISNSYNHNINLSADMNGNNKIDLTELILLLQDIAGFSHSQGK